MADQQADSALPANPLNPAESLKRANPDGHIEESNPAQGPLPGNESAVTKAERVERHGEAPDGTELPAAKKARLETHEDTSLPAPVAERRKGQAPIKAEYLIERVAGQREGNSERTDDRDNRGDQAEDDGAKSKKGRKKQNGQNKARDFGVSRDALALCGSRTYAPEFSPDPCTFQNCKFEHDLRKYLREGKREDLKTFAGRCPVFDARGKCGGGWRCRFASAHSTERTLEDGRKELMLIEETREGAHQDGKSNGRNEEDSQHGVVNNVSQEAKIKLRKKDTKLPKSDQWVPFLIKLSQDGTGSKRDEDDDVNDDNNKTTKAEKQDNRAQYIEPPFLPSEKRRIYYGPETPVLAPLTTQGNLPFRRLCVGLGAQITWSEMAMGLPLVQGEKSEWALTRAHESELQSPMYTPTSVLSGYDNAKDIRFGVQIAANKPWLALKTTEVLTTHLPHLRAIDLNCGCPIDLVFRQGAGSALLDTPAKLEKILRGMNAVSGEVPITVKIRMGTKDNRPTADKLVKRLAFGGGESQSLGLGPAGVACITLHGRSRQQRYTRSADWSYIAECASVIESYRNEKAALTDTVRAPDARDLPANPLYFCGNGDCYSHIDYQNAILNSKVDSVMVGRGALIKPWLFEEIAQGQYLDKSATERLSYIEQFCRFGLETWGSDEMGVGTTRRFLLEWLSFSCRYVPLGLLEVLPPSLQDRPPAFRGRNELETLLASENYKDWIKISEMYLGPAASGFRFEPKHRSNSYEIEAEG